MHRFLLTRMNARPLSNSDSRMKHWLYLMSCQIMKGKWGSQMEGRDDSKKSHRWIHSVNGCLGQAHMTIHRIQWGPSRPWRTSTYKALPRNEKWKRAHILLANQTSIKCLILYYIFPQNTASPHVSGFSVAFVMKSWCRSLFSFDTYISSVALLPLFIFFFFFASVSNHESRTSFSHFNAQRNPMHVYILYTLFFVESHLGNKCKRC